jgi:hypothetical protein
MNQAHKFWVYGQDIVELSRVQGVQDTTYKDNAGTVKYSIAIQLLKSQDESVPFHIITFNEYSEKVRAVHQLELLLNKEINNNTPSRALSSLVWFFFGAASAVICSYSFWLKAW